MSTTLPTVFGYTFPTSHVVTVRVNDSAGKVTDSDGNEIGSRLAVLLSAIAGADGNVIAPVTEEQMLAGDRCAVLMEEIASGRMAVPTRKEFAKAIGATEGTISNTLRALRAKGSDLPARFESVETAHREAIAAERALEAQMQQAMKMSPEMLRALAARLEAQDNGNAEHDAA